MNTMKKLFPVLLVLVLSGLVVLLISGCKEEPSYSEDPSDTTETTEPEITSNADKTEDPDLNKGPWDAYEKYDFTKKLYKYSSDLSEIKEFYYGNYIEDSKTMLGTTPIFVIPDFEQSPYFSEDYPPVKEPQLFQLTVSVPDVGKPQTEFVTKGISLRLKDENGVQINSTVRYRTIDLNDIPELSEVVFTAESIKDCYWEIESERMYNLFYKGIRIATITQLSTYKEKDIYDHEDDHKLVLEHIRSILIYMAPQSD